MLEKKGRSEVHRGVSVGCRSAHLSFHEVHLEQDWRGVQLIHLKQLAAAGQLGLQRKTPCIGWVKL